MVGAGITAASFPLGARADAAEVKSLIIFSLRNRGVE